MCRCVAAAIDVMTVIAVSYTVMKATVYVKFFIVTVFYFIRTCWSCIFGTDFDTHTHMRFVWGCCLPQNVPKSSKHFIVQAFAKTRNWALTHQLHQPTSCDAMFSLSFSPTIIMVIADCPSLEQWFSLIWVISNFTLCLNFWNILSSCSQCTRRKM